MKRKFKILILIIVSFHFSFAQTSFLSKLHLSITGGIIRNSSNLLFTDASVQFNSKAEPLYKSCFSVGINYFIDSSFFINSGCRVTNYGEKIGLEGNIKGNGFNVLLSTWNSFFSVPINVNYCFRKKRTNFYAGLGINLIIPKKINFYTEGMTKNLDTNDSVLIFSHTVSSDKPAITFGMKAGFDFTLSKSKNRGNLGLCLFADFGITTFLKSNVTYFIEGDNYFYIIATKGNIIGAELVYSIPFVKKVKK